ncbi:DUF4133 domain-containing protein [Flavobacterium sp. ZT3R18]|uniref:DUF4133 domain-containing protein n=1 Tax=Flavobacterium laiguense TaxID=2169409 RepID=A0A2U1JZ20_9FLAO|nr:MULTISPECIES: DUF4133 domain-containing protein [Flavobacterium]PWA10480.1 hypothetical protein DB891_04420 [Flavobacterium laiguense]TRX30642.1 DUF4133 domain-containing protein [Flavobacterium sp. ZT3R18]
MVNSVYQINKGINQSIEFKGLKAQYIWYLGGGVVVLMILFAAMYIVGLPSFVCVGIIGIAGTLLVLYIYRMSHKYGEHGMMKALAKRQVPKAIRVQSRKIFKMQK